jgi:hypothetical protein
MKIEIIKPYRLLQVGAVLDIDRDYCKKLISKGFAKSLEVVAEEVVIEEVAEEKKAKKK